MSVHPFGCNLCEAMCGLDVTVEAGRVTSVRGDPLDVFSRGHICPKASGLKNLHEDPARLRSPMRRTASGAFEAIGWDAAFDEIERRLGEVRARHGRDAVAFYFGNPTVHTHGASLGTSMFAFALRSKNVFNANSQDSNPRLFSCLQLYGDPLSVPVPDIDRTDLLVLIGANPLASNGSMWGLGDPRGRLKAVRERGGRIVLIDPRRNETAALCDEHLALRPGSDAALLLAVLHTVFSEGLANADAIDQLASGREALERAVRPFSPERVADAVGLEAAQIRGLARALCAARRAAVYGRLGPSQNAFGPVASWLVDAVNVVTGHFDREGGVMFPSPAADVAPLVRLLTSRRYGRWRSRVRGLPEFLEALPSAALAEEIETPGAGQIRALITFAGDPVLSVPNGPRLARALDGLEYQVAVDFYLNETSRRANVVLPPAHVFETGNFDLLMFPFMTHNFVRYSPAVLPRAPGSRDNFEILSELMVRVAVPKWARPVARKALAGLPDRVIDALLARSGFSLEQLAEHPHGVDLGPLRPSRAQRVRTSDGRVRLAPQVLLDDLPRVEQWLDAPRDGLLLIGRRHLRSNNSWMHNLEPLVKGPSRSQLLMHPLDAAPRDIVDGGRVRLSSRVGAIEVTVKLTDEVRRGVVCMPHGFGHRGGTLPVAEGLGENVNAVTDDAAVEPVLGTSILTGVPVEVARAVSAPS